jgi:hypothetical protein
LGQTPNHIKRFAARLLAVTTVATVVLSDALPGLPCPVIGITNTQTPESIARPWMRPMWLSLLGRLVVCLNGAKAEQWINE